MTFDVAADAYDRFMGRYSGSLAPQLADLAGVRAGQRALDVGCGPGALTTELVGRLGAERSGRRGSLGAVRRGRPLAPPRRRGGAGRGRGPALRGRRLRRVARAARRVLHERSGRPGSPRCGGSRARAGSSRPACGISRGARRRCRPSGARWLELDPGARDESGDGRRARGAPRGPARGGGARRRRRRRALAARRARALRGVVGPVHLGRRAGGGPPGRTRRRRRAPSCANVAACSWATGR